MSKKQRKVKKRHPPAVKPKRAMTNEQNMRLQQAQHAQSVGNLALAESVYRSLIAEKIRTPQILCNLAAICARTERIGEAENLWKQALAINPRFLEAQMNLAESLQQAGKLEQAIRLYEKVVSDHGQLAAPVYLLANILKSQGNFEEAKGLYQQVMTRQPTYTQAHFSYSSIHKYRDADDPHIVTMLDLYEKPGLTIENRLQLAFALAKAFEDVGDFPRAFTFLKTGNDLRAREFHYRVDGDRELMRSIIRSFTREAMAAIHIEPQTSDKPIFIVGMPRSGTSLVEKIIASHSDVHGAGELDYIFALGTRLFLKQSVNFQFGPLDRYPAQAFEQFGKTYMDRIALLDGQASRLTDKMPFNMMMIGLIKIALPNAKIIHCVRDAKDTCLSIYKQNFTTGNYRFAYDLRTVAQFHKEYQLLMNHWHEVVPNGIYDVSYEALTHDPETEIRKLLDACDLPWQEACLHFDRSDGIVKTASAYQARQPMYTSSVRLWQKYGDLIQPMLDELDKG